MTALVAWKNLISQFIGLSLGKKRHQTKLYNMNGHKFSKGRKYDREMERAFVLIYHNIKRLQDGRVYERATNRVSFVADQVDLEHTLQRLSTTSDPFNGPTEGVLRRNMYHESSTRPKSRFLSEGYDSNPSSQQRKVSFVDDYTSKELTKGNGHTRT